MWFRSDATPVLTRDVGKGGLVCRRRRGSVNTDTKGAVPGKGPAQPYLMRKYRIVSPRDDFPRHRKSTRHLHA